jgi:hypothetical protein
MPRRRGACSANKSSVTGNLALSFLFGATASEHDEAQPPFLMRAGDITPTLFITPGLGGDVRELSKFVNLIRTKDGVLKT